MKKCKFLVKWQGRRDLNPWPTVLETVALPTELHPYPDDLLVYPGFFSQCKNRAVSRLSLSNKDPCLRGESRGGARLSRRDAAIKKPRRNAGFFGIIKRYYSTIFATTPAPTVRPPSRIAKRRPSFMATGAISFTVRLTLSPGMTISVPAGSSTSPVTSVVRK